jgi:hypothetical protein
VIGLVSLLVTSGWILRNEDLQDCNLGIVYENDKYRFFLFDYDHVRPWDTSEDAIDNLLSALNAGDIDLIKNVLSIYIERCLYGNLAFVFIDLLKNYDSAAILKELKELIDNKFTELESEMTNLIIFEDKAINIQNRLIKLKQAIENFSGKIQF